MISDAEAFEEMDAQCEASERVNAQLHRAFAMTPPRACKQAENEVQAFYRAITLLVVLGLAAALILYIGALVVEYVDWPSVAERFGVRQ